MTKHPVQILLETQNIRTLSFTPRHSSTKCLGAYCTMGGLLRAVAFTYSIFKEEKVINAIITDIVGATTNSGRLYYWPNIPFV